MLKVENEGVTIHVKSIVYDGQQYRYPVYWMVAVGSRVALQSIFASMVSKVAVQFDDGVEKPYDYRRYYRRRFEIQKYLTVPDGGKMHAFYKKLESGLSVMVMYSSLVKIGDPDRPLDKMVLLCAEGEDEKKLFYQSVNSEIRVPLCEAWAGWLWDVAMKSHGIVRLDGSGMKGFYLDLYTIERAVEKEIGPAIRKGVLKYG